MTAVPSLLTPTHPQPRALPGFAHINRYWDRQQGVFAAKILPGEYYVSTHGEMIVTVLGSCVSACIRDTKRCIGGMNHFMLPYENDIEKKTISKKNNESARYGNWAMEQLINVILKNGGSKKNLEVKLFGGGSVIKQIRHVDVAKKNIDFVMDYIKMETLQLAAQDLGGCYPRKVLFFPDTGSVKVKRLRVLANDLVFKRERDYSCYIKHSPHEGMIELFD